MCERRNKSKTQKTEDAVEGMGTHSDGEDECRDNWKEGMGWGVLKTQLQRQVGTQIAKLIIFAPPRVNLNKRNTTTTSVWNEGSTDASHTCWSRRPTGGGVSGGSYGGGSYGEEFTMAIDANGNEVPLGTITPP